MGWVVLEHSNLHFVVRVATATVLCLTTGLEIIQSRQKEFRYSNKIAPFSPSGRYAVRVLLAFVLEAPVTRLDVGRMRREHI